MNENHKRRVISTLEFMDEMLARHLHALQESGGHREVADAVRELRTRIDRDLRALGGERKQRDAIWELLTSLTFFEAYLHDISPEILRKSSGEFESASDEGKVRELVGGYRSEVKKLRGFMDKAEKHAGRNE